MCLPGPSLVGRLKIGLNPGWDLKRYFRPETFTETANLTHAVALSFPCRLYTLTEEAGQGSGTRAETGRAEYPGASHVVI